MLDYSYAVQIWAVFRKLNELQEKIRFVKARRDIYQREASPDGVKTVAYMRANRALCSSLSGDLDRYRAYERRAAEIGEYIYPFLNQAPQHELDCQVLSFAVSRCGTQRIITYANILKWPNERVRCAAGNPLSMVSMYDVDVDGLQLTLISGEYLNAQQQRLFAVHGGHGFDLSYFGIYKEIESEWLKRVQ